MYADSAAQNGQYAHTIYEESVFIDVGQFSSGAERGNYGPAQNMTPGPASRGRGGSGTQAPEVVEKGGLTVV